MILGLKEFYLYSFLFLFNKNPFIFIFYLFFLLNENPFNIEDCLTEVVIQQETDIRLKRFFHIYIYIYKYLVKMLLTII